MDGKARENTIEEMSQAHEVFFTCDRAERKTILDISDIDDAWARLKRFAPYVRSAFPETTVTDGIIDSPIQKINNTKSELELKEKVKISGDLYVSRRSTIRTRLKVLKKGFFFVVAFAIPRITESFRLEKSLFSRF